MTPNPQKRRKALKDLCPCNVRVDIPDPGLRQIFECLTDENGDVRDQTLHCLGR